MYTYSHMRTCTRTGTRVHVNAYTYTCSHNAFMYTCSHNAFMYMRAYTYSRSCTRVHIHAYIYTFTRTRRTHVHEREYVYACTAILTYSTIKHTPPSLPIQSDVVLPIVYFYKHLKEDYSLLAQRIIKELTPAYN